METARLKLREVTDMTRPQFLKIILAAVLVILGFLLQTCVCSTILGLYSIPNILLFITVMYGLRYDKYAGLTVGVMCGLLTDMFCGNSLIGFYILIYALLGILCGLLHRFLNEQEFALPVIMTVICDLLYGLYVYVFMFLLRGDFRFGMFLNRVIFPEALFTAIAAFILFWIMRAIFNAYASYEKRRARKFG